MTMAQRIRDCMVQLKQAGKNIVPVEDLVRELGVCEQLEKSLLYSNLCRMYQRGEVERMAVGLYALKDPSMRSGTIQRKLWLVLRARRSVALSDLRELAEATEQQASDFIASMEARGVVNRVADGRWVLVEDDPMEAMVAARRSQLEECINRMEATLREARKLVCSMK